MTSMSAIGPSQWRALLASVVVAALGYLAFTLWGGWHDVVDATRRVGWNGVAILLGLSAVNYALRFMRWQIFLTALGHPQPWRPSLMIYLAGFALTTTPGKVGETLRSLFLKRRGVDHAASVAAFVSERLSDLVAIALLCALGWQVYPPLRPLIAIGLLLAALPVLLIVSGDGPMQRLRSRTRRSGRLASSIERVWRMLEGARRCHRPRVFALATLLSLAAWSAEAWGFHLLLTWLAVDASAAFAFFTYSVGLLAGAISFLPGGLGGTEATMTALVIAGGGSHAVAVTATVLIRLATLWFAVLLGLGALARLFPLLRPLRPSMAPTTPGSARG